MIKKTGLFVLVCMLFRTISISAQIPYSYYDSAGSLSGESLKYALHNIIKDHTEFPYTSSSTDTWDILKETDKDTANSDNVTLLYSGWSVNAAQEYNSAKGWSREHVWAKSHGSFGTDKGAGTDVHHLRPCDISVNSARGNDDFNIGGSLYIDGDGATECKTDADSWEARDAVKGDVARMLFYMATRYEGEDDEPDLELVDEVETFDLNETGKGFHGKLSVLLQWHKEDPVDSFEIRRNDVIYSYQGNRNPFIDHPEYVEKIWGTETGTGMIQRRDEIKIYPNPAKDYVIVDWESGEKLEGKIYTLSGQFVFEFKHYSQKKIRLTNMQSGSYIIKFKQKNDIFTNTLLISK